MSQTAVNRWERAIKFTGAEKEEEADAGAKDRVVFGNGSIRSDGSERREFEVGIDAGEIFEIDDLDELVRLFGSSSAKRTLRKKRTKNSCAGR